MEFGWRTRENRKEKWIVQWLIRYLVERQDLEWWEKVLTKDDKDGEENPRHKQFINQVVEWVLPESTSADEVSCIVKAFMASELIYVY